LVDPKIVKAPGEVRVELRIEARPASLFHPLGPDNVLMTRSLDAAIQKLVALPAEEQDRVARWLMEELKDEDHWTHQFAESQDALAQLADEAVADSAAGRATELDPKKL